MAGLNGIAPGGAAAGAYGVSAGLDLLSGVFGFLTSLNANSIAQSRADLIRTEAEANAQRYSEQAAQFEAHEKVMYTASGVKLAGSPVDALATTARIANENIAAIIRSGDAQALNQEIAGVNSEAQGRTAIVGGVDKALGMGLDSYVASQGGSVKSANAGVGVIAQMLGGVPAGGQ